MTMEPGRNQRLFMSWLAHKIRSKEIVLPWTFHHIYLDIDPRVFDPKVDFPCGVSMKPNWRQIVVGLAERGLLVITMDRDLSVTVHEKRFPDDYICKNLRAR